MERSQNPLTGPCAWNNPTDAVAAPFAGSMARRLVARHRGTRWQIAQAFGEEDLRAAPDAGELARRRIETAAWKEWTAPSATNSWRSTTCDLDPPGMTDHCGASAVRERVDLPTTLRTWTITSSTSSPRASASCDVQLPGIVEPIRVLESRLCDGDERLRWRTGRSLSALREASTGHASGVATQLGDGHRHIRWGAVDALSRMDPHAAVMHEAMLNSRRRDHSVAVRRAAEELLQRAKGEQRTA
mmetsp:Transcript_9365/g.17769  ORF Transcript_9365/g.17769 Transcript_9365/m.17769 type:complete len:244 (+) Transcript_9365:68-799(+)